MMGKFPHPPLKTGSEPALFPGTRAQLGLPVARGANTHGEDSKCPVEKQGDCSEL